MPRIPFPSPSCSNIPEVPILKNDYFSGRGGGGGGGVRQPYISVSNNAPSFGQVWIKMITMMIVLTVVHLQSGSLFSIVPH